MQVKDAITKLQQLDPEQEVTLDVLGFNPALGQVGEIMQAAYARGMKPADPEREATKHERQIERERLLRS